MRPKHGDGTRPPTITAGASNNTITIGVRFPLPQTRDSPLMIGDSLTQNGSTSIFRTGIRALVCRPCKTICALGVPCGFINHGMASQTMQRSNRREIAAITNGRQMPSRCRGSAQNNSYSSTGVAGIPDSAGSVVGSRGNCGNAGRNGRTAGHHGDSIIGGTITSAAIDTLRKNWNTIIRAMGGGTYVADWDLLTSDGGNPRRGLRQRILATGFTTTPPMQNCSRRNKSPPFAGRSQSRAMTHVDARR